jgi:predicted enzyme related to lactoylglutathione lyase
MTGRVVHFEVPYDDGDRARAFYAEVFGWKINEMPEMQYTSVSTGPVTDEGYPGEPGYINGGMFERSANSPATLPVVTVEVDDADAALESIEQHGGKTVAAKFPVGEMGFAAYFEDCEGNVLGLWQSAPSS